MNLPWSSGKSFLGWLVALAVLATASQASAYTLKPLYDFCAQANCADGAGPIGPLLRDPAGNIFGVTYGGGTGQNGSGGTVFEIRLSAHGKWIERVLHSFCLETNCTDGEKPSGELIQDAAGNLYGTAMGDPENCGQSGACGVVFELMPNRKRTQWKYKIVYRFCHKTADCRDGGLPRSGLYYAGQASGTPYDGVSPLYVAASAGAARNVGGVVELNPGKPRWQADVIHTTCGRDCSDDYPGLARQLFVDASGTIYAATGDRIFELTPEAGRTHWAETTLRRFCAPYFDNKDCLKGAYPSPPSVRGEGASFFGTAGFGGKYGDHPDFVCQDLNHTAGCGVLYKLVQDGERTREKVLHDFCSQDLCTDGAFPDPNLSMDSAGNLFGTALDGGSNAGSCNSSAACPGVVFQFGDHGYQVLYSFCSKASCADGETPEGGVILDASGNLFGAAYTGGQHGEGRIYELVP